MPMTGGVRHLHYIDWLRVLATCFVVAHHTAQIYEPQIGTALLAPFLTVNAGFGMALFFMIAGYFTPRSLASKGTTGFLLHRLVGFGIPLVIFTLVIFAVISYLAADTLLSFPRYFWQVYLGEWQVAFGPLWFLFHLLVYSLTVPPVLAILRLPPLATGGRAPGHAVLLALVAALALMGGLTHTLYPPLVWTNLFGVLPVEPAHLPQYLLMFAFGVAAGRTDWLATMPRRVGLIWLAIGIGAAASWYALGYLGPGIDAAPRRAFAIWEAFLCVGMCVGLVTFAREFFNRDNRVMRFLGECSYGVFLLHFLFVIGFSVALRSYEMPLLARPFAVAALSLTCSYALSAWLLSLLRWRVRHPAPRLDLPLAPTQLPALS